MLPRTLVLIAVVCSCLGISAAAHADTQFKLTFTSDAGQVVGSGILDLNNFPSSAGGTTYYEAVDPNNVGATINSLNFTIDGASFSLGNETLLTTVSVAGGVVADLEYSLFPPVDQINQGLPFFSVGSGIFYYGNALAPYPNYGGTVAAAAAVAPEPSCLALLSTGVITGIGVLRRRHPSPRVC